MTDKEFTNLIKELSHIKGSTHALSWLITDTNQFECIEEIKNQLTSSIDFLIEDRFKEIGEES